MPDVIFSFGDSTKEVDLKDINSLDDVVNAYQKLIKTEKDKTKPSSN